MHYDAAGFERAERRFREEMWSCAPIDAVVEAGVQSRRFGPILATSFAALPEITVLNVIQGAAEPGAVEGGHLTEAVEWMRAWEVNFALPVTARRPESELAETWLSWHGCEQSAVVRKYARGAGPIEGRDPAWISVRRLEPEEDEGLSCMATDGFGLPDLAGILFYGLPCLPGWQCYVAYLEGEEVACGAMMIDNGVAMLALDATLSPARGQGCHRALLRRRLRDAAEAGCHTVMAMAVDSPGEPTSGAARNLFDAGFIEVSRSVVWQELAGVPV